MRAHAGGYARGVPEGAKGRLRVVLRGPEQGDVRIERVDDVPSPSDTGGGGGTASGEEGLWRGGHWLRARTLHFPIILL